MSKSKHTRRPSMPPAWMPILRHFPQEEENAAAPITEETPKGKDETQQACASSSASRPPRGWHVGAKNSAC